MKCPHCLVSFFESWNEKQLERTKDYHWHMKDTVCPSCNEPTIFLLRYPIVGGIMDMQTQVYPRGSSRPPIPKDVPEKFSKDYNKAALVLADAPEASASMSRKCLQNLLREKAGITKGDLSDEIQQVLDSNQLPSYLADDLDAVRNIGNFGTHPIKSKSTGEIVEVESGEAEWTLDVLDGLFDFYFVQPEIAKQKRNALNQKLKDAGKPPMK